MHSSFTAPQDPARPAVGEAKSHRHNASPSDAQPHVAGHRSKYHLASLSDHLCANDTDLAIAKAHDASQTLDS